MRCTLWRVCAVAFALTLGAPAAASADVASELADLDERRLSPVPLVPVNVPSIFSPLNQTLTNSRSIRRSGYAVRLAKNRPGGDVIAVIFLERGAFRSVRQASAYYRRQGFSARSTRVRGKRGVLLTRRLGRTTRNLVWKEDGRVYELGSGTPRTVSLRQLRATAAGLEELVGYFLGSTTDDQDRTQEANFGVTETTVSGSVSWTASCVDATGAPATMYAGSARVEVVKRQGNAFSFGLKDFRPDAKPWTGTATGTVQGNSVNLSFRATGSFDGLSCDTGQVSFSMPRFQGIP